MIPIERSLNHTAWADDRLFACLERLSPEALACSYAPGASTVADLAAHIVSGAEWYRYVLCGIRWGDPRPPSSTGEVRTLRDHLRGLYAVIIPECRRDDEVIVFADEGGDSRVRRSTLLSQVAYHSTEHRSQIAVALELNGFGGVVLDDFDLWAYEREGN